MIHLLPVGRFDDTARKFDLIVTGFLPGAIELPGFPEQPINDPAGLWPAVVGRTIWVACGEVVGHAVGGPGIAIEARSTARGTYTPRANSLRLLAQASLSVFSIDDPGVAAMLKLSRGKPAVNKRLADVYSLSTSWSA